MIKKYPIIGSVSFNQEQASQAVVLNASGAIYPFGDFTLVDRSTELVQGRIVTAIGMFATNPATTVLKIFKRNSAGNYDVVVNQAFSHPGGGWQSCVLTQPFTVPGTGHYIGAFIHACTNDLTASIARAYVPNAEVLGTGQTMTEDSGLTLPMQYSYEISTSNVTTVSYKVPPACCLWLGQSMNAAFHGTSLYAVRHTNGTHMNINPSTGVAAQASEPLAGVDGNLSCVASVMGDLLLDDGIFPSVWHHIPALGGTYMADWAVGGAYNSKIALAKSHIDALGLSFTHVMLGIGETDAYYSPPSTNFLALLQSIIGSVRAANINAPIIITQETWCNGSIPANAGTQVRAAQATACNGVDVFLGHDRDLFGNSLRLSDQTHFNDAGRDADAAACMTDILSV